MSKITIDRAKIEQALEALESYKDFIAGAHILDGQWHWIAGADQAANILREALAQPAQQQPLSDAQRWLTKSLENNMSNESLRNGGKK